MGVTLVCPRNFGRQTFPLDVRLPCPPESDSTWQSNTCPIQSSLITDKCPYKHLLWSMKTYKFMSDPLSGRCLFYFTSCFYFFSAHATFLLTFRLVIIFLITTLPHGYDRSPGGQRSKWIIHNSQELHVTDISLDVKLLEQCIYTFLSSKVISGRADKDL